MRAFMNLSVKLPAAVPSAFPLRLRCDAASILLRRREVTYRRPRVLVGNARGHRTLDSSPLLGLLDRMRQDSNRSRKYEKSAAEQWRKTQFGVDDRRRPIDIHRKLLARAARERLFDELADLRIAARNGPQGLCAANERKQFGCAWIDRMKPVTVTRDDLAVLENEALERIVDAVGIRAFVRRLRCDRMQQFHALLAGAAVDVVERVDRRSHRAGDRETARHRHPGYGDRGRLGTVIDRRYERGFEELGLRAARHLAA